MSEWKDDGEHEQRARRSAQDRNLEHLDFAVKPRRTFLRSSGGSRTLWRVDLEEGDAVSILAPRIAETFLLPADDGFRLNVQ
jgi:hypothetical protein